MPEFLGLVFNHTVKYEASSKFAYFHPRFHREAVGLCGRGLHLWSRQIFHGNEKMLAALALEAILLHVVGQIRKLGPRLRLDPFPGKKACRQGAGKSKEAEIPVEQSKDNPKSDPEKY